MLYFRVPMFSNMPPKAGGPLDDRIKAEFGTKAPFFSQFVGAEMMGVTFDIHRPEMDAFAARSHERAYAAQQAGLFDEEIVQVDGHDKEDNAIVHAADEGVRPGTTAEKLGGLDTLAKIERVTADKDDRPQEPITITATTVFSNPFDGVDEEVAAAHAAEADPLAAKAAAAAKQREEDAQPWYNVERSAPKPVRDGVSVGRFLKLPTWSEPPAAAGGGGAAAAAAERAAEADAPPPKKPKRAAGGGFGDFSGW